jgi:DNA-binding Xre family transcriptional regulator
MGFGKTKEPLQMGLNIDIIRQEKNLSKAELADKAGITRALLYKILRGGNCETDTLKKICNVLDMKFHIVAGYHERNNPENDNRG